MNLSDGQVLYEAYAEHAGWRSDYTGQALPSWELQADRTKAHWEHAATVLLRQQDGSPE